MNSSNSSISEDEDWFIPVEALPYQTLPVANIDGYNSDSCFIVTHIENPGQFFIACKDVYIGLVKGLSDNLCMHYSSNNDGLLVDRLPIGSMWAVKDPNNDGESFWYRGKVIENLLTDNELSKKGSVRIKFLCVDFGNFLEVDISFVRYLETEFILDSPAAIPCRLAEVYPKNKFEDDPWCNEAINYFNDLVMDEYVKVYFIKLERDNIFDVILENKNGLVINEELVLSDLAVSKFFSNFDVNLYVNGTESNSRILDQTIAYNSSPTSSSKVLQQFLENFDPMNEAFKFSQEAPYIDSESAELVLKGWKNTDDQRLCKFYRKGKTCPRGNACKFEHTLERTDGVTTEMIECYSELASELEIPSVGMIFPAVITAVYSTDRFYIVFPWGLRPEEGDDEESMDDLGIALRKDYRSIKPCIEPLLPALSELKVIKEINDDIEEYWRVKIMDISEDYKKFKVFLMDLGVEKEVSERDLLPFLPQYLHYPSYAVECYLYDISPAKDSDQKRLQNTAFKNLVHSSNTAFVIKVNAVDMYGERLGVTVIKKISEVEDLEVIINESL